MTNTKIKYAQPDEGTPFGFHLKEVTKYLNIGLPSFTGTFNATLPEEERWKIQTHVPGRTFAPITKPIDSVFNAPTWSLGRSMAAHITIGRIGEVYQEDLKDTIYQICGRRDEQWELVSTKKDRSIASFIQELNQHIRRHENQMCNDMIELKNAKARIIELEGELKSTRKDYMDEIVALARRNGDLKQEIEELKRKLASNEEDEYVARPDNYIIIDDTDSDPSDDEYEDKARADIMESSTNQNF